MNVMNVVLLFLFAPVVIPFYLTTTMDVDTGISRKLTPKAEELQAEDPQIHSKNIYKVVINNKNQLFVEGVKMDISQLRDRAKSFINNHGRNPLLSDNPEDAIISLKTDRGAQYKIYIEVQNELAAAYNELRNEAALNKFGEPYTNLNKMQQKEIRKMYPQKISEAEPTSD